MANQAKQTGVEQVARDFRHSIKEAKQGDDQRTALAEQLPSQSA